MRNFEVSELLGLGAAYTVMGICIVFLILIIIMFVIKAMALFSAEKKPEQVAVAEIPAAAASEPETDDLELVAVITAAIAASLGTSAASIRVKSYKKVGAWNKAGRREVLENRF